MGVHGAGELCSLAPADVAAEHLLCGPVVPVRAGGREAAQCASGPAPPRDCRDPGRNALVSESARAGCGAYVHTRLDRQWQVVSGELSASAAISSTSRTP